MVRPRLIRYLVLVVMILMAAMAFTAPLSAQGGNPNFNIDRWETEPLDLYRGGEFKLKLWFTNNGSYGANEVTVNIANNGNFTGLEPGPRFVEMGIGGQGYAELRVGIGSNLITGYYSVPIEFAYHNTIGGSHISQIQYTGVFVTGLPPTTPQSPPDTGRPRLVIDGAEVAPAISDPGVLNLTLQLRNTGNRWATGVVVNLAQSEYFSPADGNSTAFALDVDIKVDEVQTVVIPLVLTKSPGERITQGFTIEYSSYSGGSYSSQQSVPVILSSTGQSPRLLIQGYKTDPVSIFPGSTFRLDLELFNVGNGAAQQVFVRLGDNSSTLGPLAPVGSSNVKFLDELKPNSNLTLSYDLVADGDAKAGLVAIDVKMEYFDEFGVQREDTETISLQVVASPFFQVNIFDDIPDPILVGQEFELPIEVINIGSTRVNVSTIEVVSEDFLIIGGAQYVGPLDGGTSGTLFPEATAHQAGTTTVEVRIHYLDDFQQPQTVVETLTFEVEEPEAVDEDTGSVDTEEEPGFFKKLWRAVLGFFGIGTRGDE